MTVVVAGQARKVGKTKAMCALIDATRELGWTAVKISPHNHPATQGGDTERYLDAGAVKAFLLQSTDALPESKYLMIESNAVMEWLQPDLMLFVADPANPEWKPGARHLLLQAQAVIDTGDVTQTHIDLLRSLLK